MICWVIIQRGCLLLSFIVTRLVMGENVNTIIQRRGIIATEGEMRAYTGNNRVRNYRGRVSNFDQSEARKQCFLFSDWLKFETLPR